MSSSFKKEPEIPEWIKDRLEGKNQPPESDDSKKDEDNFDSGIGMEISRDQAEDRKPAVKEDTGIEEKKKTWADVLDDVPIIDLSDDKKKKEKEREGFEW